MANFEWLFLNLLDSCATVSRLVAFYVASTTTSYRIRHSGVRRLMRSTTAGGTRCPNNLTLRDGKLVEHV